MWEGRIVCVQPRIRLWRSFNERAHTYLGYCLHVQGSLAGEAAEFTIGIGKAAQDTNRFKVGDIVEGESEIVPDPRREPVEYYKTHKLRIIESTEETETSCPPWLGVPPDLPTYRERGHRRLDARTFAAKCTSCMWGCRMPVEMIVDHWNPHRKRYRFETFCYGPKSCPLYKPGPTRKVPGRKGMTWEEEDWVDEEATDHREPDE